MDTLKFLFWGQILLLLNLILILILILNSVLMYYVLLELKLSKRCLNVRLFSFYAHYLKFLSGWAKIFLRVRFERLKSVDTLLNGYII